MDAHDQDYVSIDFPATTPQLPELLAMRGREHRHAPSLPDRNKHLGMWVRKSYICEDPPPQSYILVRYALPKIRLATRGLLLLESRIGRFGE